MVLPPLDEKHVFDNLVLNARSSGSVLQEPHRPPDGPLIILSVWGTERLAQLTPSNAAGGLRVADSFKRRTVKMPVGVYDVRVGHCKDVQNQVQSPGLFCFVESFRYWASYHVTDEVKINKPTRARATLLVPSTLEVISAAFLGQTLGDGRRCKALEGPPPPPRPKAAITTLGVVQLPQRRC